ncbi:hypothetical protein BD324DRAFT_619481 [Kockovaella imperatae]|uniref:Uncharacterized protein n=1 Tax=Kockovaella imperatae TaxID=4999 RepID=A0A1Y1UPA6_9TREE|nr:hypothetical protein BD324DRAFT_619481 [Kockovaella imperatae]ORX39387.1 hypothetical protein BD324DRAFT_619481 [Kockovaella imperatae]
MAKGVGMMFAQMGVWIGVLKYGAAWFVDGFYSAFEFWIFYSVYSEVVMIFWPFPSLLKYVHSSESKAIVLEYSTNVGSPLHPKIAGGILAALVLGASAKYGMTAVPFIIGSYTLMGFTAIEPHRMTVKVYIKLVHGLLALVAGLTGLILGIIALSGRGNGPLFEARHEPSPWLDKLMVAPMIAVPCAIGGILVAMALRYDYGNSVRLTEKGEPGEKMELVRSSPAFKKPMFKAAMIGLAVSTSSSIILHYYFPTFIDRPLTMLYSVPPLVTASTFIQAWRDGAVDKWWGYEETW